MKTQLLITIEHAEDVSVDGLINYTLNPMVHDINSDIQDGYSITIERLENRVTSAPVIHSTSAHFDDYGCCEGCERWRSINEHNECEPCYKAVNS